MTINLLTAITATNILYASTRVKEGMEGKDKKKPGVSGGGGGEVQQAADNATEPYTKKKKKGVKSKPAPATEEEEDKAIGARIDYAATLEGAYDNLQKMLGGDGMKGLTKETASLVKQQKGLMDNLNQMAPVLKTAKETLEMLSSQSGGMEKLTALVGGLATKQKT